MIFYNRRFIHTTSNNYPIQVSHSLNFIVVKKLKEVIASLVLRTGVKDEWTSGGVEE